MNATIVIEGPWLIVIVGAFGASFVSNVLQLVEIVRLRAKVSTLQGVVDGLRDGLRAAAVDEKVTPNTSGEG